MNKTMQCCRGIGFVWISLASATAALGHDGQHHHGAPVQGKAAASGRLEALPGTDPIDAAGLSGPAASQLRRARSSAEHEDYRAAEDSFRRWVAAEPSTEAAHIGLAYALMGQHRFREALESARSASRLQASSPETLALLGDLHFALGNDVEAAFFFERLAQVRLDLGSLSRLSLLHQYRGRFTQATVAMQEALKAGVLLGRPAQETAWCRLMLGELDLSLGRLDAADREFEAALVLDPTAHAASWRRAQVERRRGDSESAERTLRELIQHSARPAYLRELGETYQDLGREAEAERWLSEAENRMLEELRQGGVGHARELVELWLSRGRHLDRAVELALRDLNEVRQDAGAFETAAWALHKAGRNEEAVPLMDEALRRSKGDPRTLVRASALYEAAAAVSKSK